MTDNQKLEFYAMAFEAIFDKKLYLADKKHSETDTVNMALAANTKHLAECLIESVEQMIKDIKEWDS